MAGNGNSGGDRPTAPQNNFGISATGGNGSADGVPNISYTGFAYGENKAVNSAMDSGLAMGAQSAVPAAANAMITQGSGNPLNTLNSPTDNPAEPITHGAPIGAGAGPEVLPKNLNQDSRVIENRQIVEKYLPILLEGARVPGAPDTYKQFLNFLMEQ